MILMVREKLEDGTHLDFRIELDDRYNDYDPELLRMHFSNYLKVALSDLNRPQYLDLMARINVNIWGMKMDLFRDLDEMQKKRQTGGKGESKNGQGFDFFDRFGREGGEL